jgi:transcriptional regulator with XRE-family HTH domain
MLHTTQTVISDYESGKSSPRADVLIELASLLKTSTDYLCGLTNNPQPVTAEWSDEAVRVARFMISLSPARQAFVEKMVYAVVSSTQSFQDDELPES